MKLHKQGARERRLDDKEAADHKQVVGTLTWLALGRADKQHTLPVMNAERVFCHLKKGPNYEKLFTPEQWPNVIIVDVDANAARCRRTRRSTPKLGDTLTKSISRKRL
jgi:hypothetical protein